MTAASYSEVAIGETFFRLVPKSRVNRVALDKLAAKITIGNYGLDTNETLSAVVYSDLTGGNGVHEAKEGITDNRYDSGTIYTRQNECWTKPYRITHNDWGSGNNYQIADMNVSGTWKRYWSQNNTLYADTTNTTHALGAQPVNKGCVFAGTAASKYLYIPMGTNGYRTLEPVGDTYTSVTAAELMVSFVKWFSKLIAIDTDGQIYEAVQANTTTTFTDYGDDGKVDPDFTPKRLHLFYNRAGETVPYVVTDRGVFVFDPATPYLYQITDFESEHPYFGNTSCVWRSELHVAAGMDILSWNGNVIRLNYSLSQDDGIPVGQNARIVDLFGSQNSLYALVQADDGAGAYNVSLHERGVSGWHTIMSDDSSANQAVNGMASRAGNTPKIIWGLGGGLDRQQTVPYDFTNPERQSSNITYGHAAGTGVSAFKTTYTLITSWFDANMPGVRKVANSLKFMLKSYDSSVITLSYQIDRDPTWYDLHTAGVSIAEVVDANNAVAYAFEFDPVGGNLITPGVIFDRIRIKITAVDGTNNASTTFQIKGMVLSFLIKKNPAWVFNLQLDLSSTHRNKSPEEMMSALIALKNAGTFTTLVTSQYGLDAGEELAPYRVSVAAVSDAIETGKDNRTSVNVSLVEIPAEIGVS